MRFQYFFKTVVVLVFFFVFSCQPKTEQTEPVAVANALSLDSLSRHTFNYFWDLADSANGNLPDRWPSPSFSSIASTGFGLASYIVGVDQGYITRDQASARVVKTLRFFASSKKGAEAVGVTGYKGFFYHFIDMKTGVRFQQVELSTIDTGLLMAGILATQVYFDNDTEQEKEIRSLADSLFRAVEWDWAMNGKETMSMGWHPERGFIDASWKGYNEGSILYIMALGSPTHPIPVSSWSAWTSSYQWANYLNQEHINFGPLFGHQYSHMFIDFKGIQDAYMREKGIDYFENSRRATYANRSFCITNTGGYTGYSENVWGLTACDGPGNSTNQNPNISFSGYNARGAAQGYIQDDGTIAPTAVGGSIPFAPEICIPALQTMYSLYGDKIYSKYGFKDAFNLSIKNKDGSEGWYDADYLGIDQGPILIQLQNYENGLIWNLMKKSPYIRDGLTKAGFTGGWLEK